MLAGAARRFRRDTAAPAARPPRRGESLPTTHHHDTYGWRLHGRARSGRARDLDVARGDSQCRHPMCSWTRVRRSKRVVTR